jgi:putative transcriptional regulator
MLQRSTPTPNRLRVWRAERRVSQVEVAEAVGMSRTRYLRIEHGRTSPTLEESRALAKALDCAVTDIWPEAA